jgi:hypothetical protein
VRRCAWHCSTAAHRPSTPPYGSDDGSDFLDDEEEEEEEEDLRRLCLILLLALLSLLSVGGAVVAVAVAVAAAAAVVLLEECREAAAVRAEEAVMADTGSTGGVQPAVFGRQSCSASRYSATVCRREWKGVGGRGYEKREEERP